MADTADGEDSGGGRAAAVLAIRELIDTYAHRADRRDTQGVLALFTEDAYVAMFTDPRSAEPAQEFHGRDAIAPVIDGLKSYDVTTHFNGQSTVTVGGDQATGETYCITYHLYTGADQRMMLTVSVRYLDAFVRRGGHWLFAERKLIFDWTETRPSSPA
jgi:ketosteroid isomerase-like protein